jgi:hypothetical protein
MDDDACPEATMPSALSFADGDCELAVKSRQYNLLRLHSCR